MDAVAISNDLWREVCPLCKSAAITRVGVLDYSGRTRFSTCDVELSHVPEMWSCGDCGSGFVQNAIPESTAYRLYTAGEAGLRWSSEPFENYKTALVTRVLGALFKSHARVLDIGANTGELLDFAQRAGCTTAGVEYSESSRSVLFAKGHAALPSLADVQAGVDVITAFDLIEHLYNVPDFLRSCHDRLNDGGHLVVLTGDIHCVSARVAGSHWWYAQYPEHIVFPARNWFEDSSLFHLQAVHRTYAARGYQRPWALGCAQMLRKRLQRRHYNGLPSLGPDHILMVLRKSDWRS